MSGDLDVRDLSVRKLSVRELNVCESPERDRGEEEEEEEGEGLRQQFYEVRIDVQISFIICT